MFLCLMDFLKSDIDDLSIERLVSEILLRFMKSLPILDISELRRSILS